MEVRLSTKKTVYLGCVNPVYRRVLHSVSLSKRRLAGGYGTKNGFHVSIGCWSSLLMMGLWKLPVNILSMGNSVTD